MLNRTLKYFTNGSERSVKIKSSIAISFVVKGLNIFVSLMLVPLTIRYVNPSQYGIWLTISSIISWFSFFDVGFGNGLRNKFAEAVAKGKHKLARIYVSTTYATLSIIIGVVFVFFLLVNPSLKWDEILNAPSDMASELSVLALIIFTFFSLQFVLQLLNTVLTANQEPAKASLFSFLSNVFSLIIIAILAKYTSGSLIYLGLSLGLTSIVVLLFASIWFYAHKYRVYAPSIRFVRFKFSKQLMTLGLKFFVIQIAVVILYQTSNIIISQLFDPSKVTPYNIVYKYFAVVPMVFSIIITPFWSAFTEAWVKKDITWIKGIMKKLRLSWLVACVICIVMVLFSGFVFKFWIGDEIEVAFNLTIFMALYVIVNLFNGIYSQFLNGVGTLNLQLLISVISSLINIPLSVFLCKSFGTHGVILSTTIVSLIGVIVYPIQFKKIINNRAIGIWAT